ncbi:hypothetical protein PILCRDRAFT_10313 [Piloderma croceum F 1598]|uniref:Uncharacterized protein n=1 Tax=Piloderma croceum (strain F 1598) TaxID=765440 RepID=A0A0C3AZR1_PILCF|nr:hypothetical protein PILCRDRAFT_10313 [Piloderma croceum F 1598]
MQLHTLILELHFKKAFGLPTAPLSQIRTAADGLVNMLHLVCSDLQSLTLHFNGRTAIQPSLCIDIFKNLYALGASTISSLALRVDPDPSYDLANNFAMELVRGDAWISCPPLRHLVLHKFGISIDAFRRMCCGELMKLEATIVNPDEEDIRDEFFKCLELPELVKLRKIRIQFETPASFIPRHGPLQGLHGTL